MKTKKTTWFKTIERPGSPLRVSLFVKGLEKLFQRYTHKSVCLMFLGKEGMISWYFERSQYYELGQKIKKEFSSLARLEIFAQLVKDISEKLVKTSRKIRSLELAKLSNKELLAILENFHKAFEPSPLILWGFLFLEQEPVDILRTELGKIFKEKKKVGKFFEILNTKIKPVAAEAEEEELLRIKVLWEKGEKTKTLKLLTEHTRKFAWLPLYAFTLNPWRKEDFLKKLKELPKDAEKALKERQTKEKQKHQKIEKALKEIKDKKVTRAANLLQEFLWLRTYRTDALRKAFYNFLSFLDEIAKRFDLENREKVVLLSIDELKGLLNGKLISKKKELLRKQKAFVLLKRRKTYKIIRDEQEINKIIQKELFSKSRKNTIKGMTAFPGIAKGKVVIIHKVDELNKVQKGDILVSPMTTPEMTSAFHKVAAIVTDEGGVTCHAAIVAREMKIPCIVGTQIATQLLKDGDIIKVDAIKGLVKIK